MTNDYRIVPSGDHFIVIDPWDERLVDDFPTEEAAQRDIERCKLEDAMHDTAMELVEAAVQAHMKKFGVDRETSWFWVHGAMGG